MHMEDSTFCSSSHVHFCLFARVSFLTVSSPLLLIESFSGFVAMMIMLLSLFTARIFVPSGPSFANSFRVGALRMHQFFCASHIALGHANVWVALILDSHALRMTL
jgi:hypothetical protein